MFVAMTGAAGLMASCVSLFDHPDGPLLSDEQMDSLHAVDVLKHGEFRTSPDITVEEAVERDKGLPPNVLDGDKRIKLTLLELQRSVVENNLKLKSSYVAPSISQQLIRYEEGNFDAVVAFSYDYQRSVWENEYYSDNEMLQLETAYNTTLDGSLEIPLATGGSITLGNETMVEKEYFDTASTLLYVSFSQPLLQGGGIDYNVGKIRLAEYNLGRTTAKTKLAVINALTTAENTYWQYYASLQNLGVQQKLYESSKKVLVDARAAFEGGLSAKTSVDVAEMTVAQRIRAVIDANNDAVINMRAMKAIMNRKDMPVDSRIVIEPATHRKLTYFDIDSDKLLSLAMTNRADYIAYEMQLAAEAISIDMARNMTLPVVDLEFQYAGMGMSNTYSWADTFKYAVENRAEGDVPIENESLQSPWQISLNASYPLGNEMAESMLSKRILERIQTIYQKGELKLMIQQQVLDAVSNRTAYWQEIIAARREVEFAEKYYKGLQTLFTRQLATGTDLKVAMESLSSAQASLIEAELKYRSANISLAQSTGTTLGRNQVDWSNYRETGVE